MQRFLDTLKKLLGKNLTNQIRPLGHGLKSWLAAAYFRFPSRKLKLIGITSTKGKTSTTVTAGRLMNLVGLKTGYISTALINVRGSVKQEVINSYKMSTIDGFQLQKYLRQMVDNGCEYVVLEMSSQGLKQNRHWGLSQFLVGVFMNLYPEHLEAHKGLENYRKAKAILFQNIDSHGYYLNSFELDQKENAEIIWNTINPKKQQTITRINVFDGEFEILNEPRSFYKILMYKKKKFYTNFIADFEIKNLFFALKIVEIFKPDLVTNLQPALSKLSGKIPGRMEFVVKDNEIVSDSNPIQFDNAVQSTISILVDYAHEPKSVEKLMENLVEWKTRGYFTDIIHILSSDGVGRDDWKKPIMGEISFRNSDYTILTTDNYETDDNPQAIVALLAGNLPEEKIFTRDLILETLDSKKVVLEVDRRKAFKQALILAKLLVENKDRPMVTTNFYRKILIVSTGVGSEYGLTQPSGVIVWDEKQVWKEEFVEAFARS
jgi:UDP-N-acetylmuramoyl-L-alanyl-D-glutamate--2,6-diaminopimelate ligase